MSKSSQKALQVIKIDSLSEFDKLKDDWRRLYAEDRKSNLFMSWEWLNSLFTVSDIKWFILAFRHQETDQHVGFAQFSVEEKSVKKLLKWNLLRLGAFPLGNYSGLLCKKGFESDLIDALTSFLYEKVNWDKLFLTHAIDSRISSFLDYFSENNYKLEINPRSVSTRIVLPESWELYLKNSIGRQTRKTYVRLLNRVSENNNLRITNLTKDSLERDVDILFKLWLSKWDTKPYHATEKKIFKELFNHGIAELNILWDQEVPVAAQALIHDRVNHTIYAYITGYNPDYSKLSPGNIIGLYSIKKSIESGYRYYDFYQGEDQYKLNLGAERRFPTTAKITNKTLKTKLVNSFILLLRKI